MPEPGGSKLSTNKFEEFIDTTFENMRNNLSDNPTTPCPSQEVINQYVNEMGSGNITIPAQDRLHIYECRKCFNLMIETESRRNEAAILRETAIVRNNIDNPSAIMAVLRDITQPTYVREFAAETLANMNFIGAGTLLRYIAGNSDEDEFLRETCDHAAELIG